MAYRERDPHILGVLNPKLHRPGKLKRSQNRRQIALQSALLHNGVLISGSDRFFDPKNGQISEVPSLNVLQKLERKDFVIDFDIEFIRNRMPNSRFSNVETRNLQVIGLKPQRHHRRISQILKSKSKNKKKNQNLTLYTEIKHCGNRERKKKTAYGNGFWIRRNQSRRRR